MSMWNAKTDDKVVISINGEVYKGTVVIEQESVLIVQDIEKHMGDRADGANPYVKLNDVGRIIFNKSLVSWISLLK
jgi:hypothetical protein